VALPLSHPWSGVEEARLAFAQRHLPTAATRYADYAVELGDRLATANSEEAMSQLVTHTALALWQQSVADVQIEMADDRSLYWGRLALRAAIVSNVDTPAREVLLAIVEHNSRGMTDAPFPDDADGRILITGFDPFQLEREIVQSNPSGLAALSLNGITLQVGDRRAHVKSVLVPVRFNDFDNGLIEGFLGPHYRNDNLSMVVTISMGREAFDLERFPGRRRSAQSPDNENLYSGATESNPMIPLLGAKPLDGPEFVEFSLPAAAMTTAEGDWCIRDNRNVQTLESGPLAAQSLARIVNETAVRGSSGGYLSNEISYRSILLRNNLGLTFPVGHVHTPSVHGYEKDQERRMVTQIRRMLERALSVL
jgi:pyrrolidone-carboxylate peptidase